MEELRYLLKLAKATAGGLIYLVDTQSGTASYFALLKRHPHLLKQPGG
jgi:hypothetical protein